MRHEGQREEKATGDGDTERGQSNRETERIAELELNQMGNGTDRAACDQKHQTK